MEEISQKLKKDIAYFFELEQRIPIIHISPSLFIRIINFTNPELIKYANNKFSIDEKSLFGCPVEFEELDPIDGEWYLE